MILTKEKSKVVYLGKNPSGEVIYVGRGGLNRPQALIEDTCTHGAQIIDDEVVEVEILGPFTLQESKDKECELIKIYQSTVCNVHHNRPKKQASGIRGRKKGMTQQTAEILELLREGELKQSEIANRYNLSRQQIYNLKAYHLK